MIQGKAAYVFPGANTAAGYRSFFREGLRGMERVFILKGGPGCGKSTLIRFLGRELQEKGYDVEFWQCSADTDSLDGVLAPALKAAVIDGTPPHVVEPLYPGAVEELVDLGACWDGAELRRHKARIVDLSQQISGKYKRCTELLAEAAATLEQGRSAVEAAGGDSDGLLAQVFGPSKKSCRHLFGSSITPRGWESLLEPLSRRAKRRFILTGPFGGGKEERLAAVAEEAEGRGLYAELYHHPLAVEELQMVWLPGLETAVVGAEEALPQREGDVVIPCGRVTDEEQYSAGRRRVKELTAAGGRQVAAAKALHDELEDCYRQAMDFGRVDAIRSGLLARVLSLADE